MKKLLTLFAALAFLLAISFSHQIFAKGHVPSHKEQVCHNGEVITVSQNALDAHIAHGNCPVPKDDSGCVGFTGDPCDCKLTCPIDL